MKALMFMSRSAFISDEAWVFHTACLDRASTLSLPFIRQHVAHFTQVSRQKPPTKADSQCACLDFL